MNTAPARFRKRRVATVYGIGAIILIGWATYLGASLPEHNVAQHWNAAWVGLDVLIVIGLTNTAWRAGHADRRVVIPAAATAGLLVADAWMDISTAARSDLWQSVVLAIAVEIPLAVISLLLARRALDRISDQRRAESSRRRTPEEELHEHEDRRRHRRIRTGEART